ncbi:MAG: patatin-like phospholipase family protein [Methyloceanibacter sp.]
MPTDQPRTAFVFAGGGSFGAVQVGQLRALVAHGLKPDMVVGSSVGAMNAGYYAGVPSLEGVERLTRIWRNLRRGDVFPLSWRTALASPGGGIFSSARKDCGGSCTDIFPIARCKKQRLRCTSSRPTS